MDNGHTTTHEFYSCVRIRVEPVQRTGFTLYTNYKCYIGPLHPNTVAFRSKKLSPSQRNWPTHEKELYVVMHALKAWRHYLYGTEFYVDVDHDTLKYFCKQPDLSGRQARWAKLMQEFDMKGSRVGEVTWLFAALRDSIK